MKLLLGVSCLAITAGCAQPMRIDPAHLAGGHATLRLEASGLAGYVAIPLISHQVVNVTLSRFPGCADGAPRDAGDTELGRATLTPKESRQTVSIPAGVELAISAESSEATAGGGGFSCRMAVRFRSEPGAEYVLKFRPAPTVLRLGPSPASGSRPCGMAIHELKQGVEAAVASAHFATVQDRGFWLGRTLNLCLP